MDLEERPDGTIVTPIGWVLIVVGVIGAFIGGTSETITGLVIGLVLANLGFGLGVLLLALGYLVRAVWFLPGREIPKRQLQPTSDVQKGACSWCGRTPAAGSPCSQIAPEKLHALSARISNPVCKDQLSRRGYAIGAVE